MDYEGRDNFANTLLRIFSIFGLVTVLSGFVLFFISSKWGKQRVTKSSSKWGKQRVTKSVKTA